MGKEQIIIVSGEIKPGDPKPEFEGIAVPCCGENCKKIIWISDVTIKHIKSTIPGINLEERIPTPLCVDCAGKLTVSADSVKVVLPSAEVLRKMFKLMNK